MGRTRLLQLLVSAVVFVVGAALVVVALRGGAPAATPAPDREFSLRPQEALAIDPAVADRPVALPTGEDLGPYVNTSPVSLPAADATSGTAPTAAGDDAGSAGPASHLYIPSLYVSAPIVPQGVSSANEMNLPDDLRHVGLLDTTSALDADSGSTLLAGHVTVGETPGALYLLGRVSPGASVSTVDEDGARTDWVVTSVRSYRKSSLPPDIFDTEGDRTLTLVTCGGEIVRTPDRRWTHEDNIVVTAIPAA
jgi:hypothetical protein